MDLRTAIPSAYEGALGAALAGIGSAGLVRRIWDRDWTVWGREPDEIANRLGWLTSAEASLQSLPAIEALVRDIRREGYREAVVLGMGGSSLAPEVLGLIFPTGESGCRLSIHDSTDPAAVLASARRLDLEHTVFLVSSKSGTTVETNSFFRYFYNLVAGLAGEEGAGRSFLALSDPGSPLEAEAQTLRFRAFVPGDAAIGGRFSVLSPFGILPAALKGLDVRRLLNEGLRAAALCREEDPFRNPGVRLGALMAVLAREGRDKLSFLLSEAVRPFGAWLEQLVAESTGKKGRGILPILEETPLAPTALGADRFFVVLRLETEPGPEADLQALAAAGVPHCVIKLADRYELGGQFFIWERATAVAGHILGVNPFEQPDVESAKKIAREMVRVFKNRGALPAEQPVLVEDGISLFGDIAAPGIVEGLRRFLDPARPGDYAALLAFLPPTPEIETLLRRLAGAIRERTGLASTWGWGPRYLHSTGQLHKGDAGRGLFVLLTAADSEDVPIPDAAGDTKSSLSFGTLEAAQARGDFEALRAAGRRVLRFDLGKDISAGLTLVGSLSAVRGGK
jgi:glucose-6-phosphate isomerase